MKRLQTLSIPLRISLIYLVFAGLWILLSDGVLSVLVGGDAGQISRLQTLKGWLFVLATTGLLHMLVGRAVTRRLRLEGRLKHQQALYRALFEDMSLGSAQVSSTGRFRQVNPFLCAMLGYSEDELLRLRIRDIAHPEDLPRIAASQQELLAGEKTQVKGDYRYLTKAGAVIWAQITVIPLVEAGRFQFFVLVMQDISARKQQEMALRNSERTFRQYFNQTLIGMGASGPDKRWIEANDRLCEILGYSREALLKTPWDAMTHPDDLDKNEGLFEQLCQGKLEHYTLEKRFVRPDGSLVHTRLAAQAIRQPDGTLDRALTLVEDVTAQEQALMQLHQSEERFHQMVQHMPVLVNAVNDEGRFVFWNECCERVTGYTAAEIVGNPEAFTLLYPTTEYRNRIMEDWRLANNAITDWMLRLTCKDGSQRIIAWSIIIHQTLASDGETWSVGVDVTEQHLAQAALRESEARYRTLVQSSPVPIVVHHQGQIRFMNEAAIRALGGQYEAQFLGRSIFDFVDSSYHALVQDRVQATYLTAEMLEPMEERFVRLGGEVIDVEVLARQIDYIGQPHSQIIFQDITDRKRSETALHRYTTRLSAMHDIDRAILAAQSAEEIAEHALRYLKDLVLCTRVSLMTFNFEAQTMQVLAAFTDSDSQLSAGEEMPLAHMIMADVLWQGKPYIVEDLTQVAPLSPLLEMLFEEGIRAYVTIPLLVQGRLFGALNIGQAMPGAFLSPELLDIAQEVCNQIALALNQASLMAQVRHHAAELEQRVAERTKALTIANARLQDLDRLKSKFVSDVSHELRTPITNLGMYLHLIRKAAPERREQYFEVLDNQLIRLKSLIEGILDLSRLDLGKHKIAFTPVDFNALVQQTVVAHQPRAEAASVVLIQEIDASVPPVWGELNQLAQVVANLITNAINFTPKGQVIVRTGYDTQHGQVMLRVTDSGIGIYPQDMPHIFDRFYRGEQPEGADIPGTGLGLGIVKEIVDLHEGRIAVESTPGEGSTFTVWLPPAREKAAGI